MVFIASTTGQGEEPDNMKKFWKFLLRKSHPSDALDHMEYTVLGLGDSSYIKYAIPQPKAHKEELFGGGFRQVLTASVALDLGSIGQPRSCTSD